MPLVKDPLHPSEKLLVKLGTFVTLLEEAVHIKPRALDAKHVRAMLKDNEVQEWLSKMRTLEIIPLPR